MGKERRQHKRHSVEEEHLACKMRVEAEARVLNMSIGGVALLIDQDMNVGEQYAIKIQGKARDLVFRGVVVWTEEASMEDEDANGNISVHRVGMKFVNSLTEEGAGLVELIEKGQPPNKSLRVRGIRARIPDPQTSLELERSFLIKDMSEGGMLIETDWRIANNGSSYGLEIDFPKSDIPVRCNGRVVRCSLVPDTIPLRYEVGIAFDGLNPESMKVIKDYLDVVEMVQGLKLQ